ncbi:hypothetical protein HY497_00270 [Candidatus Woesearchaeota archaeon]|nr:hypothetical protein [Candidatus Woesearchaeota archaeon]
MGIDITDDDVTFAWLDMLTTPVSPEAARSNPGVLTDRFVVFYLTGWDDREARELISYGAIPSGWYRLNPELDIGKAMELASMYFEKWTEFEPLTPRPPHAASEQEQREYLERLLRHCAPPFWGDRYNGTERFNPENTKNLH